MSASTGQFPESPHPFSAHDEQPESGDVKASEPSQTAAKPDPNPMSDMSDPTTSEVSKTPVSPSQETTAPAAEDENSAEEQAVPKRPPRQQPIPPPSEPMQYRAIGLVRGRYLPSEEQFNRGELLTEDGVKIDAVLLGRVTSLVKKHLDPEQDHLWVVYPRTREKMEDLHIQVVGVWEPESLQRPDSPEEETEDAGESAEHLTLHAPQPRKNYFSVRGEIVFYDDETKRVVVRIQQAPKRPSDSPKAFKLNLQGDLPGSRTVGHFWDLSVERQGDTLTIIRGERIAMIPPQRQKKKRFPPKRGKFGGGGSDRPAPRRDASHEPRPKPTKRKPSSPSSEES